MSYKLPTRRHSKKEPQRLNLIPILDAVFIFIFFLLMSAQFVKIFEINSDVPIVSDSPPPKNQKKPLALTLSITNSGFTIAKGLPSRTIKRIPKNKDGLYDTIALHNFLVQIKKANTTEKSIVFEPKVDLTYETIVKIMDAVRMLDKTDEEIYIKDKDGIDLRVKELFNKIVFGNLMS
ncbi:MAG: biopolymer transporter ExbD [Bacteriovoracaceae bacterium]|nr:biopolymer transporter ExbD [Bacteriovoracaceae bacterium]